MPDPVILQGDCLEVLPTLADNSVDLIATDPPYFKVKGEAWDRQWSTPKGFLAWLDKVLAEFYRILKPNGSLYLFASPKMAARVEVLVDERFNVLNRIVWSKPAFSTKAEMNPKKWQRGFFPTTEHIIFAEHYGADGYAKGEAGYVRKCDELRGFVFEPLRSYLDGERLRAGVSKEDINEALGFRRMGGMAGRHYFSVSQWQLPTAEHYAKMREAMTNLNHGGEYLRREYEDLRREYEDLRRPFQVTEDVPYTDVWTFPTVNHYRGKHPCEKPLAMMEHIVRCSSRPGGVVLDAFMGSGTTGVAAVNLGRSFVGIEQLSHWCDVAMRRITHTPHPLFASNDPPRVKDGLELFATSEPAPNP